MTETTWRDYYCTGAGNCTYTDYSCSSNCYYCGDGRCDSECGENSSNCPADCGAADSPGSCTITASKYTVNVNESFTITVSASDNDGVDAVYYRDRKSGGSWGSWNGKWCTGSSSCTKSWSVSKSSAGTYEFQGSLRDNDGNYYYCGPISVTVQSGGGGTVCYYRGNRGSGMSCESYCKWLGEGFTGCSYISMSQSDYYKGYYEVPPPSGSCAGGDYCRWYTGTCSTVMQDWGWPPAGCSPCCCSGNYLYFTWCCCVK